MVSVSAGSRLRSLLRSLLQDEPIVPGRLRKQADLHARPALGCIVNKACAAYTQAHMGDMIRAFAEEEHIARLQLIESDGGKARPGR